MYMGIYNEPTNSEMIHYKGLYRQNNLLDFIDKGDSVVRKYIDWFFEYSNEGNYMEYAEKDLPKLLKMIQLLKLQGWDGELIVFTDNHRACVLPNMIFLGYDICADSRYYSPLGDGFLEQYDLHRDFYEFMNQSEYKLYQYNINNHGLFSDFSFAYKFSLYCNYVNQINIHSVESENNWRPFAVFSCYG